MKARFASYPTALVREMTEETGHRPARLWTLPSVNSFYEWHPDRVTIAPAFAAQLTADPLLTHAHDAFAWLSVDEATVRLAWPEQRRLLGPTARLLRSGIDPSGLCPVPT